MRICMGGLTATATAATAAALVAAIIGSSSTARAQELPAFTKDSFPLELASRPLILPAGMFEVRAGAMSDLVGEITDDTRVRGRFDVIWSPFARAQGGVELDAMIFPTDEVEVRDLSAWAEYDAFGTTSLRVGAYVQVPSQLADPMTGEMELGDPSLGFRLGFPIKVHLGKRIAITANPRYGLLVAGGDRQDLDLPFALQLSPIPQISLYASSGVRVEDVANFSFDVEGPNVRFFMPLVFGGVLTPGNLLDLGLDVRMTDLTDEDGRQERWVFVYMAVRR